MSYYYRKKHDFMITKREVLFSIIIIAVMLVIGFLISGKISDKLNEKHQEYNTAIKIENDADLFSYGIRTDVGNAFVYGDLKAVDTVTYPEIDGEYSYVKKVKEKYTMHTRTVTTTVNGRTSTRIETYWTWDYVDSWNKHSDKISFLGVEFDYETIPFPSDSYITTINESSHIRYVYYGTGAEYTGTLYTELSDNTINDTHFYKDMTITETIEDLESGYQFILFWVFWLIGTSILVFVFYYIDNKWLEDKSR